LLFGPGGFVRLFVFGRGGVAAESVDLTCYAEALACIGVSVPRGVARPSEVTGEIEVWLGEGGRALWVDGGGDISEDDLGWAIAAALEERPDEVAAAFERINREWSASIRSRIEGRIRDALAAVGFTPRGVSGFLRRRQEDLGGRSIRDVLDDPGADVEILVAAVLVTVRAMASGTKVR
jgi:hypothetical protein